MNPLEVVIITSQWGTALVQTPGLFVIALLVDVMAWWITRITSPAVY